MNNNEALTLPEIQQEALKVLIKLHELCEEHGWKYFITYGTLLGAIRHNGFIPWDDDVDVFMPRKDFDMFCDWCEKNEDIIKPFKLCNCKTVKDYPFGLPRLCNMDFRYVSCDPGFEKMDLGVFVDIYSLDNYGNTRDDGIKLVDKIIKTNKKVPIYISGKTNSSNIIKKMIKMFYHFYLTATKPSNYAEKIYEKNREIILSETDDSNFYVGCPSWTGGCYQFKKEWFERRELHNFEKYSFYIPSGFNEFLTCLYGNYMELPPEEKRHPYHGYSVLKR